MGPIGERFVFLSGPMGAGKSATAEAVAQQLGFRTVDLDDLVAKAAGQTVDGIFAAEGEAGFRSRERAALEEVLAEPGAVVALGGGTVTGAQLRRRLLAEGCLVTLEAPVDVLLKRVGGGEGRPLLRPDPAAALSALLRARSAAYAECHGRVDSGAQPPRVVAEQVVAIAREVRVAVPLGDSSYVVEIGAECRHRLGARVTSYGRSVLVADTNTAPYRDELVDPEACRVTLEAGEVHKTLEAAAEVWDRALAAGVDRSAVVVAVGGGVVGDLAGFAAATLLRGVAFGQVPTTVLSMVDSSVGGKTGFNRPAGKNLVGAFHQPRFVLCDPRVLATLERAERISGLAEVAKAAWLDGEGAVADLEADAEALVAGDEDATVRAIRMAVSLKAAVVADDERERGRRMLLNLGHTVGHALEAEAGYGNLRHGEAVSLGMVAALRVAQSEGRATEADLRRMVRLLEALALPTDLDRRLGPRVWPFIAADKKRSGSVVRFVVPGAPGEAVVTPLSLDAIRRSVSETGSR